MSDALDIYEAHRAEQLQNSPFSETFSYGAGSSFKGIFDNPTEQDDEDQGGVSRKIRRPRIICDTAPTGLGIDDAITRIRTADIYKVNHIGLDDQGIVHLWLY